MIILMLEEIDLRARLLMGRLRSVIRWNLRGWEVPAPAGVKRAVLARYGYPSGTWIESGTYVGDTTAVLARTAYKVISIEPSDRLALRARKRFRRHRNVHVIHAASEDCFRGILDECQSPLSIFLDGHASGGITFSGKEPTPIATELTAIEAVQGRLPKLAVFIDDFRGFTDSYGQKTAYPPKNFLVRWAEDCRLNWTVEHDVFIAYR